MLCSIAKFSCIIFGIIILYELIKTSLYFLMSPFLMFFIVLLIVFLVLNRRER